jgi:hypothetical protein
VAELLSARRGLPVVGLAIDRHGCFHKNILHISPREIRPGFQN